MAGISHHINLSNSKSSSNRVLVCAVLRKLLCSNNIKISIKISMVRIHIIHRAAAPRALLPRRLPLC